jgi:hypothetical protein
MSVGLSTCLSVYLLVCRSVCLFVDLSACLSVCLLVCRSVGQSTCLSVYLLVCQSVCLSVGLSACLSVCLLVYRSVCLSIGLSSCLSVFLSVGLFVVRFAFFRSVKYLIKCRFECLLDHFSVSAFNSSIDSQFLLINCVISHFYERKS